MTLPDKLPITFEANVATNNRVTIPVWLKYIEPGDVLEGYVQLIDQDDSYPFNKKVLSSRHITIGHVKPFLKRQDMPSRVRITIEKVQKQVTEVMDFNLLGYKEEETNYSMIFSTVKPETQVQFQLDTVTENFIKKFFEDEEKAIKLLLQPFYLEDVKKWIKPLYLPLENEMGSKVPTILYLILSQDYYQKLIDNSDQVDSLLKRVTNWIFHVGDFTIPTLSIISSQLQTILETGEEPEYYDARDLFKLPDIQRQIVLMLIKEHFRRGMTITQIYNLIADTTENVNKAVDDLVKVGILRSYEEEKTTVVDTLWVV